MKKAHTTQSLLFLLALLSFAGCKSEIEQSHSAQMKDLLSAEESFSFVTEALPLHGNEDFITDAIYVRFYDGNRYVPYVPVKYFLQECADFQLESSTHTGKIHVYENEIKGNRFSLLVDAEKDTIYCPEWYGYAGLTGKTGEEEVRLYSIIKKIMAFVQAFSEQKPVTFDLKKYGFKIYSGIDDAYVPLCILNNLFTTVSDYRYVYNGKDIYAVDTNGKGVDGLESYDSYLKSPWFTNEDGTVANRPKELIFLNYNLLRFTHDYLYGQPGYYGFADDGSGYAKTEIAAKANDLDFDSMLKTYDPETRKNLLSDSYADYFNGLMKLLLYTYGDCHSRQQFWNFFPKAALNPEDVSSIEEDGFNSPAVEKFLSKKFSKFFSTHNTLEELRKAKEKETNTPLPDLLPDGKTAVIRFDSFAGNLFAWEDFYSQNYTDQDEILTNMPRDTMGLFYVAFYILQNDEKYKDVTRVIFDLSINGGGAKIACQKVLYYLTGKGDMLTYDPLSKTKNHDYVQTADLNLSGKADLEDVEIGRALREKYQFAVITSFASFSCGNYFPVACSQSGIPLIGERSGGGSCVVGYGTTAEGFLFSYSLNNHLCRTDWTSVENGEAVTEEMPYENFYDDEELLKVADKIFK